MKLLFAVVCCALFFAVEGTRFEFKCIRLDINGTVTLSGKNTKTNTTLKAVSLDLSKATPKSVTGDCSKASPVKMTVTFDNTTSWELTFKNDKGKVSMDQSVTFNPKVTLNATGVNGSVTVSSAHSLPLSASNKSFQCDSPLSLNLAPKVEGNYSFSVSQAISYFKVQAFNLPNTSYSPAEHCSGDLPKTTTVAPATTTPPPVPSAHKVDAQDYVLKDAMNITCFRVKAGLQMAVEYENTKKAMVYSKVLPIPKSVKMSGSCAGESANTAAMTLTGDGFNLTFTETRTAKTVTSAVTLSVKLDPVNFPDALQANKTLSFTKTGVFKETPVTTFFVCSSLQSETLAGTKNSSATLYTNDFQLQAFNLVNGSFTGSGERCSADPTPTPMPPASKAGDNTYMVKDGNVTCIVLKGEISFGNVTYDVKGGKATAKPISIPLMNETTHNVKFSGSCNATNGTQQLTITFNNDWKLTLTFAKGNSSSSSNLNAVKSDQYSVRAVMFEYYQTPEFFPNATKPGLKVMASQKNISDFMKGSVGGGSWKCDAKQSQTLSTGVQFSTSNLQYKAFNKDNSTTFNNEVNQCSADDQSNSIVPIAVGAALAGLVVVVLIAYLIGRRRSRRQGYESV